MAKSFAVLGMGKYGSNVAKTLYANGSDVLIADKDPDLINYLADSATYAMVLDLSDPEALARLSFDNMEAVIVAMSGNLEASIMCTMAAKDAGVPLVLAKVSTKRMGDILKKCGADQVIEVEEDAAIRTAISLQSTDFLDYFDLSSDLCLLNMRPKADWVGKSLLALGLRDKYNINVVAIKENGETISRIDPNMPLNKEQELIVVMDKKSLGKLK